MPNMSSYHHSNFEVQTVTGSNAANQTQRHNYTSVRNLNINSIQILQIHNFCCIWKLNA